MYKLYVEEKLMVRRKKRKRLVRERAAEPRLMRANQEWAMDSITDRLATGRKVRILSVVDAYTRECLALGADTSLGSGRVTRVLPRLITERGKLENVRSDLWCNVSAKLTFALRLHTKVQNSSYRPRS